MSSATRDNLEQVCDDNREELAQVLNIDQVNTVFWLVKHINYSLLIGQEDVVMTWVSELQSLEVCKLKFKQALS